MTRTSRHLLVVVVAGVAVFASISIYGDVHQVKARLVGFAWWRFGAALALACANYAIRFVRWTLYLRSARIEVPPRTSGLIFVGGFSLSVSPGKVGDLIKCFLLRATHAVPIARSAPVVLAERVTDLVAILFLGLGGVAIYGVARTTVLVGIVLVGGGLAVLAWPRVARGIIDLLTRPGRLRRLRPRLHELYDGLAALVAPWPLTWGSLIGTVAWLAECLAFALIVAGFPGTEVPLGLAIVIYAATTLAGALSFLPGGLGVTEAGMTWLLVESAGGVDAPAATAATILTRLATLWFAVGLGVVALAILRRRAPAAAAALAAERDGAPGPGDV